MIRGRRSKWAAVLMILTAAALMGACGRAGDEKAGEPATESSAEEADEAARDEAGDNGAVEEMPEAEQSLRDRISAMEITYTYGDISEVLTGQEIAGWLVDMPDGSLSVNEAPAKEYVASLAKKHDTFGKTRTFRTHDGDEISVAGGNYGFWTDRVSTRQELIAQILTGESATMKPVYYGEAVQYGSDDIGSTYVEINIGQQHLWVYQDGQVVNESDFVSGGLMKGNNTPDGVYAITYKERDSTLVGEGYSSSVKYWMPFNNNIGMHDASWRDTFGGHIYYMNGSHGCINLPSAKAAEIYDQVTKGEPVVVYGSISKEEAIPHMTPEEQIQAIQKGYIPMTVDAAAYLLQMQGMDEESARNAAQLQIQAQNAAALQAVQSAEGQPSEAQPGEQLAEQQPAEGAGNDQ